MQEQYFTARTTLWSLNLYAKQIDASRTDFNFNIFNQKIRNETHSLEYYAPYVTRQCNFITQGIYCFLINYSLMIANN